MPHTTEIRLAKSAYKKFTNYQSGPLFKMLTDMKLKDKVTNKQDKQKNVACLQEMALMFTCWEENEFDQSRCTKQIQNFEKCWQVNKDKFKLEKEAAAQGIILEGQTKLTSKQVNKLLSRFPQPKS